MKIRLKIRRSCALACILFSSIPLGAQTSFALDADTVKSQFKDYHKCGYSVDGKPPAQLNNTLGGVAELCASAQSTYRAWRDNGILSKVYIASATVCSGACAASMAAAVITLGSAEAIANGLCTVSELAKVGTDLGLQYAQEKDTNALMSGIASGLGGAAMSAIGTYSAYKAATAAGEKAAGSAMEKGVGRVMVCVSAGMSVAAAVSKQKAYDSNEDTLEKQLKAINRPDATGAGITDITNTRPKSSGGGGTGGTKDGSSDSTSPDLLTGTSGEGPQKQMEYALSLDGTPDLVKDPRFADAFKKMTGQNLGEFVTSNKSPQESWASVLSNSPYPQQVKDAMTSGMNAAREEALRHPSAAASNASMLDSTPTGGGGAKSAPTEEEPPLDKMMADLMAQFMPKEGQPPTETDKGIATVVFANQKFLPDTVTENRKLSIFDRITYRYLLLGKTWLQLLPKPQPPSPTSRPAPK